jgi:hypothetical protein
MVICSNCKAYTDDQQLNCGQCGAPLQPDQKVHLALQAHHPDLARLVQDQARSQLIASAVVIAHHNDFFYESEGHQTVLVKLFGSGKEPRVIVAGLLFAAYAYLCQKGYCAVRVRGGKPGEEITSVVRLRPWDGQNSVEGAIAEQVGRSFTTREATEKTVRELMGFRLMEVREGFALNAPKARNAPTRSALAAIDQLARVSTLPDHDPVDACRSTYRLLTAFIDEDSNRARILSSEIAIVLREFEAYT